MFNPCRAHQHLILRPANRHIACAAARRRDRSSRPHHLYRPTPASLVERIEALRRQRFTGARIAKETGVSPATGSSVAA